MRTAAKSINTRADALRQRRTVETPKRPAPVSRPRTFNATSAAAPVRSQPVVTRRAAYTAPSKPRVRTAANPALQSRVRRKVYYSYGDGVELSMPALPAIKPGWRLLSGFLFVLLAAAIIAAFTLPMFEVKLKLSGMKQFKADDIQAVVKLENKPVFLVNPAKAAHDLTMKYPQLANVKVSVSLPNLVTVSAVERKPILGWEFDGATTWVDQEGVVFTPRGEVSGLVIVQSEGKTPLVKISKAELATTVRTMRPEHLNSALALSKELPDGAVLVYSRTYGFGWVDSRGWNVYFGMNAIQDIEIKLAEYQKIVEKLDEDGIHPSMVSVEYIEAPFYRTE